MPRKPNYDRDELIECARDLFWRQGWAGTSLKDLEDTLQMKPGSFYAAFGSKDALYGLTLDKYLSDGMERLRALEEEHGALGALQKFPFQVIANTAAPARACMLSKTFLELHPRAHPLAEQADANLSKMEAAFAALFAKAQDLGEIDAAPDPANLARKYQSDLLGLRVSAERNSEEALKIAEEMAESLTRTAQAT